MHHKYATLLHEFVHHAARENAQATALIHKQNSLDYLHLSEQLRQVAAGLNALDLQADERVAIYLPKTLESVVGMLGTNEAGGVFVPVNPLLKPPQVAYILRDCNVRVLITSADRADLLAEVLPECRDLHTVVITGDRTPKLPLHGVETIAWKTLLEAERPTTLPRRIDADMAAIIYTSGSTGRPKGVVLSHRNMVAAAHSTAEFQRIGPADRLLVILPLSFDYGLNQVTTAFSMGASAILMDYLVPRDVIRAVARHRATGLSAVPPIWGHLARMEWPPEAIDSLRYITSSGGALPVSVVRMLREALPKTDLFLMYGLTEAFRSTYLPPDEIDERPESVGKAVPGAEVMVVREDGSECAPGEPGELVHRGTLVAMGYWNDPEKTAERFRPAPSRTPGLTLPEIAVWSGDRMKMDEDGYLYFISRKDEMIKTSSYRVSPTEVEEVVYSSGLANEAVAVGVPHPELGQAILVLMVADSDASVEPILAHCRKELPNFMVPHRIINLSELPRNQNGKIDRKRLAEAYRDVFLDEDCQ